MWYLTEEYRWDSDGDKKYYHIVDSKVTKTSTLGVGCHYIDGSLIEITKLEDNEVEGKRSRKRRNE